MDQRNAPAFRVSGVQYQKPVGKVFSLGKGGILEKGVQASRSCKGVALDTEFPTLENYANWREPLDGSVVLFSGRFTPEHGGKFVTPATSRDTGQIDTTGNFLAFRTGPTMMRIDFDTKSPESVAGMTPNPPTFASHDALRTAFIGIEPAFRDTAVLASDSSSARIQNGEVELTGSGGIRFEVLVADGREIPAILEHLHKRSILAKFGWAFVSGSGTVLVRSLVDMALRTPTQPDFAAATLHDGLTTKREFTKYQGGALQMRDLTPLSDADELMFSDNYRELESALQSESATQKAVSETKRINLLQIRNRSMTETEATRIVRATSERQVLLPEIGVDFANCIEGSHASVLELLENGEKFDGMDCYDPLEPDYGGGRAVAKFYWNDGNPPCIHSLAHGPHMFWLRYDCKAIERRIEAGVSMDQAKRLLSLLDGDAADETRGSKKLAKAVGLGSAFKDLRVAGNSLKNDAMTRMNIANGGHAATAIRQRATSLKDAMPESLFPEVTIRKNSSLDVKETEANLQTLLDYFDIQIKYNVITKELEVSHPEIQSDAENQSDVVLLTIHGRLRLANANWPLHITKALLDVVGSRREINPVVDALSSYTWDGVSRLHELADRFAKDDAAERVIAQTAVPLWMLQCCAAADNGELGAAARPDAQRKFEHVLVLAGQQGTGKTTALRMMMPPELRLYFGGSAIMSTDKDSQILLLSHWTAELGELEASLSINSVSAMKAFLSRYEDSIRRPYGLSASKRKRRTSFCASVNGTGFLADMTGNRRLLVVEVGRIDWSWEDDWIGQCWAEAWYWYANGCAWWPTGQAVKLLTESSKRFQTSSPWMEVLRANFDWAAGPARGKRMKDAVLFNKLHQLVPGRLVSRRCPKDIHICMGELWAEHGAIDVGAAQTITPAGGQKVRTFSDGGNPGWLTPPLRVAHPSFPATAPMLSK
jgi:predicted P-loop ATPase